MFHFGKMESILHSDGRVINYVLSSQWNADTVDIAWGQFSTSSTLYAPSLDMPNTVGYRRLSNERPSSSRT